MRTPAAAMANAPSSAPMVDADIPRSCPKIGSTKVCTSHAMACSQLTNSRRRSIGTPIRSHTDLPASCGAGGGSGCSGAPRTSAQHKSGNEASTPKATRKPVSCAGCGPAWSISRPVTSGPRKFAMAGAMAIQLNTVFSSDGCATARPTWRCSAICAVPADAPVSSAITHSTPNVGHAAASAVPSMAAPTASRSGTRKPCRSASRPAGNASTTGESANSASSTPTCAAL